MAELLEDLEIEKHLDALPGWRREGAALVRDYVLKDFAEALAFVNKTGQFAEEMNHHPDIDIRWNKVRLALSTHSKGGITELDFELARKIQALRP